MEVHWQSLIRGWFATREWHRWRNYQYHRWM